MKVPVARYQWPVDKSKDKVARTKDKAMGKVPSRIRELDSGFVLCTCFVLTHFVLWTWPCAGSRHSSVLGFGHWRWRRA